MPQQSKLLSVNSQLGLLNDVYQDTNNVFRESQLSNYLQIAVADLFAQARDKSLFSTELEALLLTDELRHELDAGNFNYLRALNLSKAKNVLDLSEDLGGVAHYLANNVGWVDSVKIDADRARLSKLRCQGLDNICHITEDIESLLLPDNHYDIVVIGRFEALQLPAESQKTLLLQVQKSLTKNGVLVVSAKNEKRIAKWFRTDNSSTEIAFQELYQSHSEQKFSLETLSKELSAANYSSLDYHATFSSAERCQNLFSENYLASNPNALNHFYRLGAIDEESVNEYLLFKNQQTNGTPYFELSSRFIVFAGANIESIREVYDNDFCHFAGTGRKPQWRTTTVRRRASDTVEKSSDQDAPNTIPSQNDALELKVRQNLAPQPFLSGRILIDDWLQAIIDNDAAAFNNLVREYRDWLEHIAASDDFAELAYDALPFNILLNEEGGKREYQLFDIEWQIEGDLTADLVLFRALFWFAFENKSLLSAFSKQNNLWSLGAFVVKFMPSVHSIDDLQAFATAEESLQKQIANNYRSNSVSNALLHSFSNKIRSANNKPKCQVSWANKDGVVQESESLYQSWSDTSEPQTLRFSLSAFDAALPILRIDPIDNRGIVQIDLVELYSNQGVSLIQALKSNDILEIATLVNAQVVKTQSVDSKEPDTSDQLRFVATNNDPYFLLDLSKMHGVENASTLIIGVSLIHDDAYDSALNALSEAVANQASALSNHQSTLNRYKADIDFLEIKLADSIEHRSDINRICLDLKSMWADTNVEFELEKRKLANDIEHYNRVLANADRDKRKQVSALNHFNSRISGQLQAQIERNEKLEEFLTTRTSARIKSFVGRKLRSRLPNNSVVEVVEPAVEEKPTIASPPPMTGELIGQNTEDYQLWLSQNTLSEADIEKAKAEIESFELTPVFSIVVPIYNTDPEYLIPMIRSVQAQIYPNWQLCLVDDASPKDYLKLILEHEAAQDSRISLQINADNQGISLTSNDALAMATGDYIGLLDHDDEISIDALYENAKVINQYPNVGLLYSDEDKMDLVGNRMEPFFKPDYSPDLLNTNNYVCHFTVIKKGIVDKIGGFREGLDGSQDHDIILRAIDKAERIAHIPKLLYHWRKIPGSTAVSYDSKSYAWEAGRRAVEDCLLEKEKGARVEFGSLKGTYRVFREIQDNPLVTIIIPFKDKPKLLQTCVDSILARSNYQNFEIIGVSNNSEAQATFDLMAALQERDERIRFVEKNIPFNFSTLCNFGVENANGDYVLLLNNDIEIESPDWIIRLLEHAQCEKTGAVGGKLLYPDGRVQHAGVVAGMVGAAGHPHKYFPDTHIGYHGRLHMVSNVSAITGAMLMVSKQKYLQVGGLDEELFAVAYNDIDFCLKLLDAGYFNVFTPHCRAVHHESLSRGYEDTDEKLARLKSEQNNLLTKWKTFLDQGDPYYNPNLSLENEHFSLNFKD